MNKILREQLGDEQYIIYLENCIRHREEEILRQDERLNKTIEIVLKMADAYGSTTDTSVLEVLKRDNDAKIIKLNFINYGDR